MPTEDEARRSLDEAGKDLGELEADAKVGAAVHKLFRKYDVNNDGVISKPELSAVLKAIDEDCWQDAQVNDLLAAADTNADGKIQYDEFVDWLMRVDEDGDTGQASAKDASVVPGADILASLLGGTLKGKSGDVDALSALANQEVIGLYFSASWKLSCKEFTPKLVEAYTKLREKRFEVVFVSSDRDQSAFDEHYNQMPWLALPYDSPALATLTKMFSVKSCPTLVLMDKNGACIAKKGRYKILSDIDGFPWTVDPELRTKCDKIFASFDVNQDGFLNFKEMSRLACETSGGGVDEEEYNDMCTFFEMCPSEGLDRDCLFRSYTEMGCGSIDDDFKVICDPKRRTRKQVCCVAAEASRLSLEQLDTLFAKYDPEKELSKDEFIALWNELGFQPEYQEPYFKALDTNENDKVCFKELMAGLTVCSGTDADATAMLLLRVYDTKGDGVIDREEYANIMQASLRVLTAAVTVGVRPMLEMMMGMMSAFGGEVQSEDDMMKEMIEQASAGMPSLEDLAEGFDQVDANKNGFLTCDELKQALESNPELKKMMLPQLGAKEIQAEMKASMPQPDEGGEGGEDGGGGEECSIM